MRTGLYRNTGLVERTGSQPVIVPDLNIYETTDRFLFRDALRTTELAYCDGELYPFQLSSVDEFLTIAISSEFEKEYLAYENELATKWICCRSDNEPAPQCGGLSSTTSHAATICDLGRHDPRVGQGRCKRLAVTSARLLSRLRAAAYCDLSPGTFSNWVAAGRLPPPLRGTRRWDRHAIDVALDKLSGTKAPSIAPSDDPFAEWELAYDARKAAGRREFD
jgi:hypothetical protein